MDTPLHALAVPDADRATLKRPDAAAGEIVQAIAAALPTVPEAREPAPGAIAHRGSFAPRGDANFGWGPA